MADNVSTFRGRPSLSPAASATWRDNLWTRAEEVLCRWLNHCGVPGAIQPMTYTDALTNQTVTVRVATGYTILTVDGRDYYFHRLTDGGLAGPVTYKAAE